MYQKNQSSLKLVGCNVKKKEEKFTKIGSRITLVLLRNQSTLKCVPYPGWPFTRPSFAGYPYHGRDLEQGGTGAEDDALLLPGHRLTGQYQGFPWTLKEFGPWQGLC